MLKSKKIVIRVIKLMLAMSAQLTPSKLSLRLSCLFFVPYLIIYFKVIAIRLVRKGRVAEWFRFFRVQ